MGTESNGHGTIAVIVLSHRYPRLISRLVSRIAEGSNTMALIHHDPRGEALELRPRSSVVVMPDPVHCPWGRSGILMAVRKSLAWVRTNVPDFRWALLVSGQDYPIRTMRSIEKDLDVAPYDACLRHFPLSRSPVNDIDAWQAVTRKRYFYKRRIPFTSRSLAIQWRKRKPPWEGAELYAGSLWFNLSAIAVNKVLDSPYDRALRQYLRFSPNPDECYLPTLTLAGNPHMAVLNDSLRFICWSQLGRHPDNVSYRHLSSLTRSNAFFARKIASDAPDSICDLLDGLALDREKHGPNI